MKQDPVCGMKVDEKTAPTATYSGKEYAFCGSDCQELFKEEPERYAGAKKPPSTVQQPERAAKSR